MLSYRILVHLGITFLHSGLFCYLRFLVGTRLEVPADCKFVRSIFSFWSDVSLVGEVSRLKHVLNKVIDVLTLNR